MKKYLGRLFLAGLTVLALAQAACANPPAEQSARINIDGATCSGTIVGQSTILSAAHCFQEDEGLLSDFKVTTTTTNVLVDGYKMFIVAMVFDDADHVLVKVDFIFKDHSTLGVQPPVGAKVHYHGNAAGLNNVYREGYITGYPHGEMQMDVNGFFGDSGSGIFDENGKVVGVMSFISPHAHSGIIFKLMGAYPLEFTPLQYSMMGVEAP
jgi:hypothetical protein